ncbi:hypothetical protein FACS1894126_6280 [Alphaproteobacteria bacterium]|nr:hypothetical protein FACS1894126_6280 [Alphaproteobacteria bacterium]
MILCKKQELLKLNLHSEADSADPVGQLIKNSVYDSICQL